MIEILVPTQWSDVNILQYEVLQGLDKKKSDFKYLLDVIKCLCNIEDTSKLKLEHVNEISKYLGFLNEPITTDKKESIVVGGDTYKWVGNFNELTAGEVISIEQIIDIEALNFNQSIDVVLAVLLRKVLPSGKLEDFDSSNFVSRRELFSKVSISEVNGMVVFFLSGGQISTKTTLTYLVKPKSIPTNTQTKRLKLTKLLKRITKLIPFTNGLLLLIGYLIMT